MWLSLMWQPLWRTTRRPCCQRTEDCGPETRSSRCAVKDFYQCSEYNCDFSVNKTEDKLSTFKNGFRLLSMQHWTSAEPAISSASQDNPGTSWNQKIHHRVQNSLSSAKLIKVKNSDTISRRSISILLFHLRWTCKMMPFSWTRRQTMGHSKWMGSQQKCMWTVLRWRHITVCWTPRKNETLDVTSITGQNCQHNWAGRGKQQNTSQFLRNISLTFHPFEHYSSHQILCNFNAHERNMHQRHLTAEITELIVRTSLVRPTGVSKCGSHTYTFRLLSSHITSLALFEVSSKHRSL